MQECKTDSVQKQYQNEEEVKAQFKSVAILDGITGEEGKFINLLDMLNSAWDPPELCDTALVLNKFVIGH